MVAKGIIDSMDSSRLFADYAQSIDIPTPMSVVHTSLSSSSTAGGSDKDCKVSPEVSVRQEPDVLVVEPTDLSGEVATFNQQKLSS